MEGFPRIMWLPITTFVMFPLLFLTTYIIAGKKEHVEWVFPYISDTGALPPESCIFGQFLNIGGMLTCMLIYIRYLQIRELNKRFKFSEHINTLNILGLWAGMLTGLGVSIVGNFQEGNALVVHLIGAVMAFGVGTVYFWIQTIISYKTTPITCSRLLCHLRLGCSIFCVFTFISTFLFATISLNKLSQDPNGKNADHMHWTSDMTGYGYHLTSVFSEWLLALSFILFLLTFTPEFKQIEYEEPKIQVRISEERLANITPLSRNNNRI